jgi:hypothetical protein
MSKLLLCLQLWILFVRYSNFYIFVFINLDLKNKKGSITNALNVHLVGFITMVTAIMFLKIDKIGRAQLAIVFNSIPA